MHILSPITNKCWKWKTGSRNYLMINPRKLCARFGFMIQPILVSHKGINIRNFDIIININQRLAIWLFSAQELRTDINQRLIMLSGCAWHSTNSYGHPQLKRRIIWGTGEVMDWTNNLVHWTDRLTDTSGWLENEMKFYLSYIFCASRPRYDADV